ncbi:hypothetical protein [Novipirellula sp.]|uniref:hypothetical protein n=1 Tax=Novipirellula sp. TaxID=2795430 RepID=UPI0035683C2F
MRNVPRLNHDLASTIKIYSNAWNDTVAMLGWGIAFATVYGVICYTAVTASADRDTNPDVLGSQGDG